ncbi:MAG: tRNA (adenosine(37)-N6)-threonylcarbamoyltransferase complex ATPase subunit type 1 TsaE [Candidatus Bipolaricaulota bacterium]|nr:tRNA (adenosine(37)-N6)-threonylcarbamoyltransferase complex ATPase subunit type 1 TsaE [Candidatus Bipolaricaulota bacterium]MDW8127096.1 tRNA (adenosine(37)-N6)-threonylcarbamoyltransferase complex ATPase subunit type 1 TsaE [Candidatus Bipolaricaulota bacterium]
MEKIVISEGPEETMALAMDLARRLGEGEVVALVGELGTGKTTFVKGLARSFFIPEEILSPSFLLARTYRGQRILHHIDLYRVRTIEELEEVGLTALLPPEEGVTAVEWADRLPRAIPKNAVWVYFEHAGGDRRKITIRR